MHTFTGTTASSTQLKTPQPRATYTTAGRLDNLDMSAGAPWQLEVSADSSLKPRVVYSICVTYAGAAVHWVTKLIGTASRSSHDAESIATIKAAEAIVYARLALKYLDRHNADDGATLLLTDNLANQRVAANVGNAANSRHFAIRYTLTQQWQTEGQLTVVHLKEAENPSDYLTKTVKNEKIELSVKYMSGKAHAHTT